MALMSSHTKDTHTHTQIHTDLPVTSLKPLGAHVMVDGSTSVATKPQAHCHKLMSAIGSVHQQVGCEPGVWFVCSRTTVVKSSNSEDSMGDLSGCLVPSSEWM